MNTNTFSYLNLLFDQTINVFTELQLKDAIFANSKSSREKIYSHCRPIKTQCKNTYHLDCFITSRTDDFGNVMTYYISQSILIVKCIKPSKPIPVLILFEITLPHNVLFVIKIETAQSNCTLDLLSFANDFLANPKMLFHVDLEQITETLNNISSEQEYNDFIKLFTDQIIQVKENKKVIDHYIKVCGRESNIDFNPYIDAYTQLYQVHILNIKLGKSLKNLTNDFIELKKSHDLLMKKIFI